MATEEAAVADFHFFEVEGRHFLYDPLTIRPYEISRELHGYLVDGAPGSMEVFRQGRQLFNALQRGFRGGDFPASDWYTLNLILTHRCNMGCEYCFDRVAAQKEGGRTLPLSLAQGEIERLAERYDRLCVVFFGGEPLLCFDEIRAIVSVCEALLQSGRLKQTLYAITSNGRLLTEESVAFFRRHHFSFTLSADGCGDLKEANLMTRKWYPADDTMLKALDHYAVRATITPEAIHDMASLYERFQAQGVRSIAFCPALGYEFSYTPGDAELWIEQMNHMVQVAYRKQGACKLGDIELIVARLRRRQSRRDCLRNQYMTCLDVDGKRYACHRMVGRGDSYCRIVLPTWIVTWRMPPARPVGQEISAWACAATSACLPLNQPAAFSAAFTRDKRNWRVMPIAVLNLETALSKGGLIQVSAVVAFAADQ